MLTFPDHIAMSIEFNEHKTLYMTVAEWDDNACDRGHDWVSAEERAAAIAHDSVWVIRWYPKTPVGFCEVVASTLDAALAAALAG